MKQQGYKLVCHKTTKLQKSNKKKKNFPIKQLISLGPCMCMKIHFLIKLLGPLRKSLLQNDDAIFDYFTSILFHIPST